MNLRALFFIIFIFALPQSLLAIQVTNLYQAIVPVSDQSAATRAPAINNAFIQVLIKLTGDRNIRNNETTTQLTKDAKRFVQQFRYQQVQPKEGQEQATTELWVEFDENAMNQALRDYGLSIWGKVRPSILVWLAYEANASRRLVSFEDGTDYLSLLDERAMARGIPLLFPLFDLEDTSRMSVSDIWAGFSEPILSASERYQADIVLTGRLIQVLPTLSEIKWTAFMDDETLSWNSQAEMAEVALEEGINELADRLAARYANIGSTRAETINISVLDVKSIDNYAKALAYLESIQSVTSVKVTKVLDNEVMFELISQGGLEVIEQAIKLGKTLEPVSSTEQIVYRLLPR